MSASLFNRFALLVFASTALIGGGCTKHARMERLLARANRDFDAGAYDKAELEYTGSRRFAPFNPVAIRQLGILYFDEGRLTHAYAFLKKAVELDPKNVQAQIKLGEASLARGAIKDARDAAKLALDREPSNEEALLLLANTARTGPEETETTRIVERLRNANKDCAGYHLVMGRMLLLHRDSSGAEKETRAAMALDPKSSAGYEDLGEIFLLQRDAKQAGQAFRTAAQLAPLRSARRLRDIDFRIRTGAGAEAKKDLAELCKNAPDYIPAWVYAMKMALAERRYDDCAAAIQTILFRDLGNYDAVTARGLLKMARNDPAGAVADLQKAEELFPHALQVKYELALAYERLGDTERAIDRLNAAVALEPNYREAVLLLADLDIRKANATAAVALLNPLLKRSPEIRQAYLLLAQAYLTEKNLALALGVYQHMAAGFPKDPEPLYRAGIALDEAGRAPQAREAFESAVKAAPGYGPALEMLVKLDLAEKHEDAAAGRVQELIVKYPTLGVPWFLKGEADLAMNRIDEAEADFGKAAELEPKSQQAYLALARLYLATDKTKEALDKLAALVDRTKSVTALMQIAAIHSALKQFDAAAADYRKLLSFDPKFGPALNNLADLDSENLGKVDEAYEIAKRAREAAPEDAIIGDTLGWVLFKKGDYHGALDLFQESAGRAPEDPTVQYHLGMAHYMLSEEGSARVAFEHAAAAGAETPIAELARSRLAVLAVDPAKAGPETRNDLERRAKAEPNDPIVAVRLAALQARSASATDAAAALEAALKVAPHNPQTMLGLARLYAGPLHDPDKARELAKSAHALAPNDGQISETLGRLLYRTGDYQQSLDLLQEAARNLPNEPDLQYDLALAEYSAGRVSDAEDTLRGLPLADREFHDRDEAGRLAEMITAGKSPEQAEASLAGARKALAADPGYIPALEVSALALEKEGKRTDAAAAYEKILAKDPLFSPAIRQLAIIYANRTGDDDRAYDLAVKARSAFPNDPGVATALGIIDYRRGDYVRAIGFFQDSLGHRADDAETMFYLGMSHLSLKQAAEAKDELEHSLKLKLHGREADQAEAALDEMKGGEPNVGTDASTVPMASTQPNN
jgi:putative PEP-CTERM system TPR-repeat lipoprotein